MSRRLLAALLLVFSIAVIPLVAACSPTGATSSVSVETTTLASLPPSAAPGASALATTPASPTAPPTPGSPLPEGTVPILYYHRVAALPADWATLTGPERHSFIDYDCLPSAFAAQLDWLRSNGYTTILPRDLAAHWDHGTALPPRPVILTFDDGTPDWVQTVAPMLQARGMVGEFYVTLDAINRGAISWDDLKSLMAQGNGIGAHDVHHVQLAMLGANNPPASSAVMWAEVNDARRIIGEHLGTPPDSMAYVGGGFNATLEGLVKKAGYTTARAILRGIEQTKAQRFELRVVRIGPYDDVTDITTGALLPGLPVFTARMAGVTGPVPTPAAP